MTVATLTTKKTYLGNGQNREWPVPFPVADEGHICLVLTDSQNNETKVTDNYKILGVFPSSLRVVYPANLDDAPLSFGHKLTVYRHTPRKQGVELSNVGAFHPKVIEEQGLDSVVMMVQEIQEQADRAIALQISDESMTSQELLDSIYNAASEAGRLNSETADLLENVRHTANDIQKLAEEAEQAAQKAEEIANKLQLVPIGTELLWPATTPPEGWLDESLDMGELPRAAYPQLWKFALSSGNIISETTWQTRKATFGFVGAFSYGNGGETFRIPLVRKAFLRAADAEGGLGVGTGQGDAIRNIKGELGSVGTLSGLTPPFYISQTSTARLTNSGTVTAYAAMDLSLSVPTAEENRPVNIARLPIIKAYDIATTPANLEVQELVNQISSIGNLVNSEGHIRGLAGTANGRVLGYARVNGQATPPTFLSKSSNITGITRTAVGTYSISTEGLGGSAAIDSAIAAVNGGFSAGSWSDDTVVVYTVDGANNPYNLYFSVIFVGE